MSRHPKAHEPRTRGRQTHEYDAVATGTLHRLAVIMALILLAVLLLMYAIAKPWISGGQTIQPVPPLPRLQPDPAADIAAERSLQRSRLDGYRWMDQEHTVARIPIARAMALLAAQPMATTPARAGTPDRGSAPQSPGTEQTGHRVGQRTTGHSS